MQAIDETGRIINLLRYADWGLKGLMEFRIIGQPAVFMRRGTLEQAGLLDISYHYLLDHQLWLRIAQNAGMYHLPRTLAAARYHPGAKNIALPLEFSDEIHRIAEWMETQPALAELLAQNRKRIQAGMHSLSAFYLVEGGQSRQALKEYGSVFRAHPLTGLRAWRRVIYALLTLLGIGHLRHVYLAGRRVFINKGKK
jgi:hypothetical protein